MWMHIWRRFWITVAALLALSVALLVVAVSLALLLVMWVWSRLTGRPLVRAVWQQQAADRASGYWSRMRGGAMPPGAGAAEAVVDVEAREVHAEPAAGRPAALPHQDDSR
jgi:hypothetical protein